MPFMIEERTLEEHGPSGLGRSMHPSLIGVLVVGLALLLGAPTAQATSLEGRVVDAEGSPVQDVSVFIYTGKPKEGPAVLCPYCYVDCGKQTKTDEDGTFSFDSVDDSLTFKLLLVKDAYLSAFSESLDPLGDPASLTLETLDMENVPPSRILKGQVIDPHGEPIVGATVDVEGWSNNNAGTTWGPAARVMLTPMAVTDSNGRFLLIAKEGVRSLNLDVSARGFAVREFYDMRMGGDEVKLDLEEGGSVTGRLMHESKPLAGKVMTISSESRSTRSNFNRQIIATDTDGQFTFLNLPSGLNYFLTVKSDSLRDIGTVPITRIQQLQDKNMEDVGDLIVQEGIEIQGRMEIAGGGEIPKDTILIVSHEQIWESPQISIPPDGIFHVKNLNAGQYTLHLRAKGYRFSSRNLSYESLNGGQLEATIRDSVSGLILEMEPGEMDWNLNGFVQGWPMQEMARSLPLRGVEPLAEDDLAARVKIRAKDQATGKTITSMTLTPGWAFSPGNEPVWNPVRAIESDGSQWMEWLNRSGPAMVKVSHPDYLETSLNVQNVFDETLEVSLTQGNPLSGIILSPDGNPLPNAQIAHVHPVKWEHEMPSLHYNEIKFHPSNRGHQIIVATNEKGQFTVPASKHPFDLMVVHETGFYARQGIAPTDLLEIRLEDWGSIRGTIPGYKESSDFILQLKPERPSLKNDFKVAKGIVDAAKDAVSRLIHGKPASQMKQIPFCLYFNRSYQIDEKGHFDIPNVPPGLWWVVLSEKKPFTGPGSSPGMFTSTPVEAMEVQVESGKRASARLPSLE